MQQTMSTGMVQPMEQANGRKKWVCRMNLRPLYCTKVEMPANTSVNVRFAGLYGVKKFDRGPSTFSPLLIMIKSMKMGPWHLPSIAGNCAGISWQVTVLKAISANSNIQRMVCIVLRGCSALP